MNRILSLALAGALSLSLASCMDHNEVPDNSRALITAQQLPAANSTILKVKEKYSTPITGNNTFEEVKEDVIFEGVVVANDISGNLYQTLVLRDIHSTAGADDDQCITVGVKTSTLFPHFALGQRVRINLNGLYVGNYSRTPKIGRPYYTSAGNLRLGPMLLEDVSTHIALVGTPDPKAPELTPRDLTTAEAAKLVCQAGDNIAASVTPQHLMYNRNHLLVGGVRPHFYCLPIIKRESHRQALVAAVTGEQSHKFFLGTDSAPHAQAAKENACGCAGMFSAAHAIELYAQIFEDAGALHKLEAFASQNGARFYGQPENTRTITLEKREQRVPESFAFGDARVVPMCAGETLRWTLVNQ